MTTIRFFRSRGRLTGFTCTGHSGYAEEGEDIVCAAISSAVTLTECILNDAQNVGATYTVDENSTRISLSLDPDAPQYAAAKPVLTGFYLVMREYENEYPEHLTVLEV